MAGLDAQKALQLSSLLAMTAQQFAVNNPGQQSLAQNLMGSAQAGIQAEALKKAKKKEDKENKAKMFGKLGNLVGGSLGGTLAYKASGGSDSLGSTLAMNTLENAGHAMSAMGYGKSSEFAQPQNEAAPRPMAEMLGKSVIPPVSVLPGYPTSLKDGPMPTPSPAVQPQSGPFMKFKQFLGIQPQETPVLPNGAPAIPMQSGMHPSTNNAINAAQKPVGFGKQILGGVARSLVTPQAMQPQKPRMTRNPDGSVDYWG